MKLYAIGLKDWIELREGTTVPVKDATRSSRSINGVKLRLCAVVWHGGRVLKVVKRRSFLERVGLNVRSGQLIHIPAPVAEIVRETFQLVSGPR